MKNLILSSVLVLIASSAAQAQEAVQWRVQDGGNGHWYLLVDSPTNVSWFVASTAASQQGGHLATITSAIENEWVFDHAVPGPAGWYANRAPNGQLIDWYGPWIGGFQDTSAADYSEPAGGWRWVTGEPWNFTAWAPTLPNDGWNGIVNSNFLRLHSASTVRVPQWNDDCVDTCGQPQVCLGFVIEWSADCNNDGVVDYGQILQGQLVDADANGVPDVCEIDPCPGDITNGGLVDAVDLSVVLAAWGTDGQGKFNADIDSSGLVDGGDLALVLGGWGPCPQ